MKILMLCEFYDSNLEFQENLLVKYYRKYGHDVTVIASTFKDVYSYYDDSYDSSVPRWESNDRGARIIHLPYRYNILNRLRAYVSIRETLDDYRPDMIFVHDIIPNITEVVSYAKQNQKCRIIFDYHADFSNSGKNWISLNILHKLIRKRFLDHLRPHLSAVFPIVPASADFLHEVYGVPREDMSILPLGADTDLIKSVHQSNKRYEIRQIYEIPNDAPLIFTGGKLDAKKKTDVLIEAVRKLDPSVHLLIVGKSTTANNDYQNRLLQVAGSDKRIHFAGWLSPEQIYRYMQASDIAVFPASQSILWQQAIATGLPLVVGDAGHQDISYLNLQDNIVILRGDQISIAGIREAVKRVLYDPLRLQTMTEGARTVASEHLDWNRLIERTLTQHTIQTKTTRVN